MFHFQTALAFAAAFMPAALCNLEFHLLKADVLPRLVSLSSTQHPLDIC